jgi:pimeloyl-ACP methyl ester carboxylesterase
MPVISVNGETIHYVKEGAGPAVVLIHSLGSSSRIWREQIAALQASFTVVAFDCRGHGQSSANGEVSMAAAASDLKALVDHLGVTRCHLVGLSMGGPIALLFNARWPGVVQSLVLADSFVKPGEGSAERVAATKEAIAYISMHEYGTQYAAQRLHPMTSLDIQDELAAEVAKVSPKTYNETMASALLGYFTDALAAVKVPTLVLVGEDDDVTPRSVSEEIAGAIEGAQLTVIANAGHLSNLDNPVAFNAAIVAFLSLQAET